jgi:hypothetical protein
MLNDLYDDNDNTELYQIPIMNTNKPLKKYKQYNTTKKPKYTAKYSLNRLKSIRRMVDVYPEFYIFVDHIVKKMIKNKWENVLVSNSIDGILSQYNNINKSNRENMVDANKTGFLKMRLKHVSPDKIIEA